MISNESYWVAFRRSDYAAEFGCVECKSPVCFRRFLPQHREFGSCLRETGLELKACSAFKTTVFLSGQEREASSQNATSEYRSVIGRDDETRASESDAKLRVRCRRCDWVLIVRGSAFCSPHRPIFVVGSEFMFRRFALRRKFAIETSSSHLLPEERERECCRP